MNEEISKKEEKLTAILMAVIKRIVHNLYGGILLFIYDLKVAVRSSVKEMSKGIMTHNPKFNCVYFTCRNDFESLLLSLRSLERLNLDCIDNIYLYSDKNNPLSKEQIHILRKELSFRFIPMKTRHGVVFGGKGPEVVISELEAYKEIAKRMDRDGYVVKVDSDVLFLSDKIFKEVIWEGKEVVGAINGVRNEVFMQGGTYFLRTSLIGKLWKTKIYRAVLKASRSWDNILCKVAEDRAISYIILSAGYKIDLKEFMFNAIKRGQQCTTITLSRDDTINYSTIHFSIWCGLEKSKLSEVWEWLCSDREEISLQFVFITNHDEGYLD